MKTEMIIDRMVQVGKVQARGYHKGIRCCRVKFDDTQIISDWLYCIDNRWYDIDTVVVCLYQGHFNSEGFILGRLVDTGMPDGVYEG